MLYLTNKTPKKEPEVDRHLAAADGYLTLGMPQEALEALHEIPEKRRNDSLVLRGHVRVLLHLKNWLEAELLSSEGMRIFPEENEFMVQRAFALHQLEKANEAAQVLKSAPAWIRNTGILHYNLACYEAKLGDLGIARQCIHTAIEINASFKKNAKADPDLQRLWN